MKEIKNLDDLIRSVGQETVDHLFTEYMMHMVAKSKRFDDVKNAVQTGASITEIKKLLP